MKQFLTLIAIVCVATTAVAQEQITVGDILDLEERILIKKMNDELTRPNPNAPAAPPVFIPPKAPKIVYPTETLAVYGTSATFYEGRLSMGGRVYTVRNGTPVQDYVVTYVAPHGIELEKYSPANQRGKARTKQKQTLFAPMAAR